MEPKKFHNGDPNLPKFLDGFLGDFGLIRDRFLGWWGYAKCKVGLVGLREAQGWAGGVTRSAKKRNTYIYIYIDLDTYICVYTY